MYGDWSCCNSSEISRTTLNRLNVYFLNFAHVGTNHTVEIHPGGCSRPCFKTFNVVSFLTSVAEQSFVCIEIWGMIQLRVHFTNSLGTANETCRE